MTDDIPRDCPACKSAHIAQMLYGFVDVSELASDLESGRVVLAGCSLSESSARWHCNTCGHEWGSFAGLFQELDRQRQEEQARLEREALARGVMEASLYPDGWVLCPHCGRSFNTQARMSWDGKKHVTCGTYLRLIT